VGSGEKATKMRLLDLKFNWKIVRKSILSKKCQFLFRDLVNLPDLPLVVRGNLFPVRVQ